MLKRPVHVTLGSTDFPVVIQARTHTLGADEPAEKGGSDTAPEPFELLLGSLGSCMVITVRMYARRKGWTVEPIDAHLGFDADQPGLIRVALTFGGDLSAEQRERLLQIAHACPVHKALTGGLVIDTSS